MRFLKHTRAKNIIEPIVPINDLFPAISYDIHENYSMGFDKDIGNKNM